MKELKFIYFHEGKPITQVTVNAPDSELPRIKDMFHAWENVIIKSDASLAPKCDWNSTAQQALTDLKIKS